MNILTQSPQTFVQTNTIDPAALDLASLRRLRAAWLEEAGETLDSMRLVVKTLGSPAAVPGWPMWTCWTFARGSVRARLFEGVGAYLPSRRDYDRIRTLAIYANDYMVCYYHESDGGGLDPDNIYVPGKWERTITNELSKAEAVYQARRDAAEEQERADLAEQLLIGVEV